MNVELTWATPNAEDDSRQDGTCISSQATKGTWIQHLSLLKYLITHKHWSPYEMGNMCVEINTTRAISPQIIRHRSF
jgi:thymidylate synthase (FAD)